MDPAVQKNIRLTCRTCLRVHNSRKELVSVFETDQTFPTKKIKFSEMLLQIANHPVHELDDLPKRICVLCLQAIRSCYFFKIQAEKSYSILISKLNTIVVMPGVTIKAEKSVQQTVFAPQQQQPVSPLIYAPRNVETENYGDDLLMEIGSPKIQEQFTNGGEEEEEDSDDDQQIIDYEPDFSDVESHNGLPHAEGSGKSPDSGIIDDRTHENIYERQLAESQISELQELVCNLCHKQMFSAKSLARHKSNFHSENKCKHCRKRLGNYNYLKMHMKYKHPLHYDNFRLNGQTNPVVEIIPIQEIPECVACSVKLVDNEALLRHHADCDQKCIECGAQFTSRESYFSHLKNEHDLTVQDKTLLECPFGCCETFRSEKILQEHIQQNHPDVEESEDESVSNDASLFDCSHCSSRFSNKRSLSQHMGAKHKSTVVELPKTRNALKYTKDEFIDKFFVRKSVDYYRCIPCRKDIHRRSIGLHLRGKHSAMKSYMCEICPEGFFRIDYRQRHMAHVHFSQYRCTDCELQFDRAYKYDGHMLQHGIPARHFKPEEGADVYDLSCAKMKYIEDSSTYDYASTTTMAMLRRPSIMSTSSIQSAQVEVPMTKDEFCEKHLITLSDKFTHCSICQQKMMKGSIISHILWKHALKKPLKCAFCNERVVKNAARLGHMARCHPNEYKCSECDVQVAKHDLYAYHMKDIHGIIVTSKPSSGEEDDLTMNEIRFVGQKNEDEVIDEPDAVYIEPEVKLEESCDSFLHLCQFCPRRFASAKNLQIHKTHKHRAEIAESSSSKVIEDYLEVEPMTFGEFRQNYVEDVSSTDLKCIVCDQVMKKRNYASHIKSRHATIGAYRCAICPESFFRPEHRTQHMSNVHRGMFFCNCCNIQFIQNSRYAKHMKDMHEIDVDSSDNYEVDLNLSDLRFLPQIKPSYDEDQISVTSSMVEEEMDEEVVSASTGSFTRDEFITRYVKSINKDNRKCEACNKTIAKNSLYNHLMRYHALTLPFKCPFCDLRLERAQYRIRHIQIFHPDDYKCNECGLQFQTHSKYADHMLVEHNSTEISEKSEGEERDLSSIEIKYVVNRLSEEEWPEDEQQEVKSEEKKPHEFLKPWVKDEPKDSSLVENYLVEEHKPDYGIEYNYSEFKTRFVVDEDPANLRCIPCNRVILRTSACAHLRLWHAITMCYNCELCSEGFQRVDYRQRHMKFSHPDDFKCESCSFQFHRSVLYKQHMLDSHNTRIDLDELKTKDEIDVPLENMRFVEHVPDSVRCHGDSEAPKPRNGRHSNKSVDPINPEAGGLTYEEFNNQYLRGTADGFKCVICRITMTKFSVKKHMKRYHATSVAFYCELCPEGFQRPDLRIQHMETVHHDSYRCFQCNVQFYLSSSYVEHMQTMHNMLIRVLSSKNKSEVDVPLDRLRFLPQRLDNDDTAPMLTSASGSTSTPIPRAIKLKKNFDDISDDAELTREQFFGKFLRSMKKNPGDSGELKTKCLACLKVFSSKNRLFHAMHNHAVQRPFKCELCPQKFFISTKRTWHMNRFHPDDYKCSYCEIQFDRAHQFIEHMQDHKINLSIPVPDDGTINIPSHVMRYTKKVTAHRTLMKQKRLGITSDDIDTPSMDSFSFLEEESLKCSECHEEFESGRSLRIHMRNHSSGVDVKPVIDVEKARELKALEYKHECDICGKKFSVPLALNAHKKFKHGITNNRESSGSSPPAKRRKIDKEKAKFDVECDICEFTSHRRDYVEHHVKAAHKPEFHCRFCTRIMSNFNMFVYHLHEYHPAANESFQRFHKCTECHRAFKTIEHMKLHLAAKHGENQKYKENYCHVCCVHYKDAAGFEIHNQNHVHKNLQKFMENKFEDVTIWEDVGVSEEVGDVEYSVSEYHDSEEPEEPDPFQKMLEKKLQSYERLKPTSEDDKLDYLNFLQSHNGNYTCGICGKVKKVRKHMLHHLKQHDEVPTFQCEKCPEKFVFKRKYEKHLLLHENDMNVDEHPRFQDILPEKNEIKCQVCQMTFKLTIMLNRHNSTWHGEENEFRGLTMIEQKAKKEESKLELAPIKLLRCKHCLEAFIKPLELKEHLRVKHNSESMDQPPDEATRSSFRCEKCKLSFEEKKFLENHQTFFCVHRQVKSESDSTKNVINEQ